MEAKNLFKSKRFWTGIIALLTGVSLLLTGEKTLNDQLPTLVMTAIGIIQTIVSILSGETLEVGGRKLN